MGSACKAKSNLQQVKQRFNIIAELLVVVGRLLMIVFLKCVGNVFQRNSHSNNLIVCHCNNKRRCSTVYAKYFAYIYWTRLGNSQGLTS